MSKIVCFLCLLFLCFNVYAVTQKPKLSTISDIQLSQATTKATPVYETPKPVTKPTIILLITEQNIEGPQAAWWASEVDLSTTEAKVATRLIAGGYNVLEPSQLANVIKQKPAFRVLGISDDQSVALGNLAKADYVVIGKSVASAGPNVPDSHMRSCFANTTAKLIRSKDGKVIAYLDATGNSAHLDVITGGKEALGRAGENLATKIVFELNKEGGM